MNWNNLKNLFKSLLILICVFNELVIYQSYFEKDNVNINFISLKTKNKIIILYIIRFN